MRSPHKCLLMLSYLDISDRAVYEPSRLVERCTVAKKRYQITVLLGREEHERFIAYCADRGFKKSTLVARLIRDHLDSEGYRLQRPLPLDRRTSEER